MLLPNQIRLRRFEFPIDICPKTDIIYMKSDIKEAVMNCESARNMPICLRRSLPYIMKQL